jgi:hypothetical protein
MLNIKHYCYFVICILLFSCKEEKKQDQISKNSETQNLKNKEVTFIKDDAAKRVDINLNGNFFTSYRYDGKTPKPILYPIITKSGKTVTRGFPFDPRSGERIDHPHHVGLWFNYGNVNGLDFWNNSYAIPDNEKDKYGTIVPQEISEINEDNGTITVKAVWQSPKNVDLLDETTVFKFGEEGETRFIDRTTTLKALEKVTFKDNKEGMLGMRVARELELPSNEPAVFTDEEGNETEVKALNNDGVTGDYLGSEGKTGDDVWGTRNDWVRLQGQINGDTVAIVILDNKKNVGYPTYWHARGYGLFAANPLGQAIFSEGKKTLNFELEKGESTQFRYRILIHDGSELSKEQIDKSFADFNQG